MNRTTAFACALVCLLAVGCTSEDDGAEQAAEQTPRSAPSPTEEESPTPTPTPTPGQAEGEFAHIYDEPVTWEDGGFSITIEGIVIRSRQRLSDMEGVPTDLLNDSTSTVATLQVSARNDSDEVAAWYPDQGQIVLGDEQVDAMMFASESVGESAWQPGTEQAGALSWELRSTFEDVVQVGSARYLVGAAGPEDIGGDRLSADADITVEWPTP